MLSLVREKPACSGDVPVVPVQAWAQVHQAKGGAPGC